jgi:hypothetical protein
LKKAERKFIHVYNSPQLQAARAAWEKIQEGERTKSESMTLSLGLQVQSVLPVVCCTNLDHESTSAQASLGSKVPGTGSVLS